MDPVTQAVVDVVIALIGLVTAILGARALPLLQVRLGAAQTALLYQIGTIVVKAVEEAVAAGVLKAPKKDTAAALIKAEAERLGLHPTDEQIGNVIEAAVADLKRLGAEIHATVTPTATVTGTDASATQQAAGQGQATASAGA